jgi:oligopeptide transport system substrate-binding protein
MTTARVSRGAALAALAMGAWLGMGAAQAVTLRVNILADPSMIDPITYSELISGDIIRGNVYEAFTGTDAEGNVIPQLALSWDAHDDNLGFTFHLRPGVKFHSGRDFTAHDVKWTLEQLLLPGNRGGLNARYLDPVVGAEAVKDGTTTDLEGVEVLDDLTVSIRFTQPDVLFPIYPIMFMDRGIVEEEGADWHTKVSAGTGPFKLVAWNRGQEVVLDAHPDYWGEGPFVDGVRFVIVPSDDTAISMYEAGELDAVYLGSDVARRVLRDPQFQDQLQMVPAAQIRFLGMNQNLYEPFKDIRVREAVCRAIDREAMVEGLYDGAALVLHGQITPGVAGFNPEVQTFGYDPERAQALIAEAGFAGGAGLPPVKITTTAPFRSEVAYYADQLDQVLGMPVEIEIVERGAHISNMNAGEVAFFPWGWSAGYPDALYFISQVWYGPSIYNRSRWQNDAFDALIEEAMQEPDALARYKLYHEAEKVLLDDWGTCPLTIRQQLAMAKPNVQGVVLTPFRFLPFNEVRID